MILRDVRVYFIAGALVLTSLAATPAHAEDPSCKVVLDALTKLISTPNHSFMQIERAAKGAGKATSAGGGETINTGVKRYVKVDDQWTVFPLSTTDLLAQDQENRRKYTEERCSTVGEEVVSGESSVIYSAHFKGELSTTDVRIWIAKRSGLPLKEEMRSGDHHYSLHHAYDGVRAPDGVQP
jgi:hypothetical protein